MIVELKGPGTVIAEIHTNRHVLELLRYQDMSWGIRTDGSTLSAWEPHEGLECVRYFVQLLERESQPIFLGPSSKWRVHRRVNPEAPSAGSVN